MTTGAQKDTEKCRHIFGNMANWPRSCMTCGKDEAEIASQKFEKVLKDGFAGLRPTNPTGQVLRATVGEQPEEHAAFVIAQTAYQQVDGDVNPKALKSALSAYEEHRPERHSKSGVMKQMVDALDCFNAAICEVLYEKLAEQEPEIGSLRDLIERRILFAQSHIMAAIDLMQSNRIHKEGQESKAGAQ